VSRRIPTAEMTLGPFFPLEFSPREASDLTVLEGKRAQGEVIELTGRVTQADGAPLENLVLEIWQADAAGRFDNPDFVGWGRAATDKDGRYSFRTIRPGAFGERRPHLNMLLLFSGLMRHLETVVFLEPGADPVLDAVEPAALRERLVAKQERPGKYRFDIRLRGEGETPFFDD
jgi:protocatechuate 3,4-dioxygenase alpha subunit